MKPPPNPDFFDKLFSLCGEAPIRSASERGSARKSASSPTKRPKSKTRESDTLAAIMVYLSGRTDLRAWRMNTGALKTDAGFVRFGLPGQADISGIMDNGRRLEIEVKSPSGRRSPAQDRYAAMIQKFGGLYILARSVDDVRNAFILEGIEP